MSVKEPATLREGIRRKCLDCCAGSVSEVRQCAAGNCPAHPYRMGKGRPRRSLALSMCRHCSEDWKTCDGQLQDGKCSIHPFRGKRRSVPQDQRAELLARLTPKGPRERPVFQAEDAGAYGDPVSTSSNTQPHL